MTYSQIRKIPSRRTAVTLQSGSGTTLSYTLIFVPATNGGATTGLRRHEGKKPDDRLRHGQVAWNVLEEKHDIVSDAARHELYKQDQDEDADDFLLIMETTRGQLHDMGSTILLNGLTTFYSMPSSLPTTSYATSASDTSSSGWKTSSQ